jgi:hypothetical protein
LDHFALISGLSFTIFAHVEAKEKSVPVCTSLL